MGVACFGVWRATLVRAVVLASFGLGLWMAGTGCEADSGARPKQRIWITPPKPGTGNAGSASSGGAGETAGTEEMGGTTEPAGSGDSGNGGSPAGGMGGGGMAVEMPSFDAGTAEDRNAVLPGQLCDRLATIQCAGEAACCPKPGRDFAACKDAAVGSCSADLLFDQIAMQASAGFDAGNAHRVFDEIERLASKCDPSIAAFGISQEGLRSMFLGTVDPGGSCRPSNLLSKPQQGAALAACKMSESDACLPSVTTWTCVPRGGAGTACFTDINCLDGLYCPNPEFDPAGANCVQRKTDGASCSADNECESLFCVNRSCVAATKDVAYCPK